uniref:Uncharacterized protein n=1 Tax=Phlebotomus papatasi TaxID=29031 RepID=A0A1B0DEP6_PHLPP
NYFLDPEDEISKKLPKEILFRIFSYLDVVSLCRCAQVSKYWNLLALDGSNWQKIDLFDFQRDIEGPVIENISQRCGGFLKLLSLKGCQSVGDQSIRTLAQHCHNIEYLDLSDCKKITDLAIQSLSKHCPKLSIVYLESCVNISDCSLKAISDGCPSLTEINISWCDLVTENGVEALARGCPKIKKFSSKGCKQVNDRAVICLATYCPNIETLSHCELITDDGIRQLAAGSCAAESLSVLELDNCPLITDATLDHLISCHNLQRIELYDCQLITRSAIGRLKNHLPNIKVHAYFAPVTPPPTTGGPRPRYCRCCEIL